MEYTFSNKIQPLVMANTLPITAISSPMIKTFLSRSISSCGASPMALLTVIFFIVPHTCLLYTSYMEIQKSSEYYLETMLMMQEKHGFIRSIDVAEHLGVTKPSVSYATKRLRENGYITMDKTGLITLEPVSYTHLVLCLVALIGGVAF